MRPLRSPGCLRFSVEFRVEMGPLLDSHAVQLHSGRQAAGDLLPEIHRQRFARRDEADFLVNMPSVEPVYDFALEQSIECLEAHHAAARGIDWSLHGNRATIAMTVIVRRTVEFGLIGKA